jgi:hypothetical protein
VRNYPEGVDNFREEKKYLSKGYLVPSSHVQKVTEYPAEQLSVSIG